MAAPSLLPGGGGGNRRVGRGRLPGGARAGYAGRMAPSGRPLWPLRARGPWLQLGFALVAAPVTLAAALTLVAFAIYAASEPDLGLAFDHARRAAAAFLVHLLAFTLSLGLAGVALLWALGRRRLGAWLATGTGAGALFALATGLAAGGGVQPVSLVVASGLGLALFALIRLFAGVRTG